MDLTGRDVVSILDLDRRTLDKIFDMADTFSENPGRGRGLLTGKIIALAFFEPSTRTRLSFDAAVKRMGGETIGFSSSEGTSIEKGESFADTIRMLDAYADLIVVRHKYEGSAKYAAEIAVSPVINGGDGRQHHPTQTMIDLYTLRRLFGEIGDLRVAIVGDLKYARTAASLALGFTIYRPRHVYLVSPRSLRMREEILMILREKGVKFSEHESLEEVIGEVDAVYVTRIQRERFPDPMEYERVKGSYRLTPELLENAQPHVRILHPLPKVDEIDPRLDMTQYAAYFKQAAWGVPVRMALLAMIMGVEV